MGGCCVSKEVTNLMIHALGYDGDLLEMEYDFDTEVKVLSYNVFLRPPGISNDPCCAFGGAVDDFKYERLHHFGEHKLGDFDIVCLQEMFSLNSSDKIELMKEYGQLHEFVAMVYPSTAGRGLKFSDGGLMILSKYPISRSCFYLFKHSSSSDALAAKGVLHAEVVLGKKSDGTPHVVHVFNTHLNATYEGTERLSEETRAKQVVEMHDFIQDICDGDDECVIICGDFNINGKCDDGTHSDEYMRMMELMTHPNHKLHDVLYEACQEHPNTYGDVQTDEAGDIIYDYLGRPFPMDEVLTDVDYNTTQERLDYILLLEGREKQDASCLSCNVEPFFVDAVYGQLSDHYGISATFKFEEPEDIII